jgi:hemerythrin superfamily protein
MNMMKPPLVLTEHNEAEEKSVHPAVNRMEYQRSKVHRIEDACQGL